MFHLLAQLLSPMGHLEFRFEAHRDNFIEKGWRLLELAEELRQGELRIVTLPAEACGHLFFKRKVVDERRDEAENAEIARFLQALDGVGVDFCVAAVERADEQFRIFKGAGGAEQMDDEVDDRLVASEQGALEHLEIVERILLLDGVAEVKVEVGSLDLDIEDVDQVGLQLGQREAPENFAGQDACALRERDVFREVEEERNDF